MFYSPVLQGSSLADGCFALASADGAARSEVRSSRLPQQPQGRPFPGGPAARVCKAN